MDAARNHLLQATRLACLLQRTVMRKQRLETKYTTGKMVSTSLPSLRLRQTLKVLDRDSGEDRAELLSRRVQDLILLSRFERAPLASQLLQGLSRYGGAGGKRGNQPAKRVRGGAKLLVIGRSHGGFDSREKFWRLLFEQLNHFGQQDRIPIAAT